MLFNSYEFIFVFLPACLVGYFAAARFSRLAAASWLAACSLFFYGWWDARYVVLLAGPFGVHLSVGTVIARRAGTAGGRLFLWVGVAANLAVRAFFKYADFFIDTASAVAGAPIPLLHIVLPLGISFFTFTQIAFLADAYRGE